MGFGDSGLLLSPVMEDSLMPGAIQIQKDVRWNSAGFSCDGEKTAMGTLRGCCSRGPETAHRSYRQLVYTKHGFKASLQMG